MRLPGTRNTGRGPPTLLLVHSGWATALLRDRRFVPARLPCLPAIAAAPLSFVFPPCRTHPRAPPPLHSVLVSGVDGMVHEVGHNFGLRHSSTDLTAEGVYGDKSWSVRLSHHCTHPLHPEYARLGSLCTSLTSRLSFLTPPHAYHLPPRAAHFALPPLLPTLVAWASRTATTRASTLQRLGA